MAVDLPYLHLPAATASVQDEAGSCLVASYVYSQIDGTTQCAEEIHFEVFDLYLIILSQNCWPWITSNADWHHGAFLFLF